MNAKLEQTTSVWMQTGEIPVRAALTADIDADVCVVGAGIAGMTTAYLLLQEGRSVVVLDDGPIGGGQTERTTAHITNAIDDLPPGTVITHIRKQGDKLLVRGTACGPDCSR